MLAITPKTKIVDIINEDYTVMSILLRLDILPGYGEKTVSQIAEENNFDLDFFVNILAAYTDPEFSNYEKLINIEVRHITDFLKKSHDFYKDEKIPELKKLFSKIIEQAVVKNNIKIIEHYFNSYLDEFYVHMEYEEKQVFPYAEELDTILKTGKASDTFLEGFKKFSIREYVVQHEDSTQEKLEDLKNIMMKYIPELKTYKTYYQVISKLYRLGKDLDTHMKLENKVLVPRLTLMASKIEKLLNENKIEIVQP